MTSDPADENNLGPSQEAVPLTQHEGPHIPEKNIAVPEDLLHAGQDTDEPRSDSPESLDADLGEGSDRSDFTTGA